MTGWLHQSQAQGSDFLGDGLAWGVDTKNSNGLIRRAPTPTPESSAIRMSVLKWNLSVTERLTIHD